MLFSPLRLCEHREAIQVPCKDIGLLRLWLAKTKEKVVTSFTKKILLLLITLLTTGCGFHLRGMIDVPQWLNNVSIVIEQAHHDLGPLLQDQLEAYKIIVNPDPSRASYLLIIESDSMQQTISSVSSSTTPRQYQLIYTVHFKLQQANGEEVIPTAYIVVTRQITINSNRILGSNDEEEQSKSEMRQDAVIQIINRLSRSMPPPTNKKTQHAH